MQQTVGGSIRILTRRVYPIADAAEDQLVAIGDLSTLVERQYEIVSKQLLTATTDGTLLRGDLLTRWQEFVGSGELLRSLEAKVGFVRERLVNAIKGKPQQAERVAVAIETGLEALVVEHGEQAAARAAAAWKATPYGAQLVEVATEDLSRATRDLRRRADAEIQAWQAELQELVRSESGEVRTSARFLAVGVTWTRGHAGGRRTRWRAAADRGCRLPPPRCAPARDGRRTGHGRDAPLPRPGVPRSPDPCFARRGAQPLPCTGGSVAAGAGCWRAAAGGRAAGR